MAKRLKGKVKGDGGVRGKVKVITRTTGTVQQK